MRFSKTALLVLGIGVFVLGFVSLFFLSSGQSGEQERLNASLETNRNILPKLIDERDDLTSQLAQWQEKAAGAEAALNRSQSEFPRSVESINYDEILFQIANECDLQIMEITASRPDWEGVEDIIYTVTTFIVKVQSEQSPPTSTVEAFENYIDDTVADVLDFTNSIATSDDFENATIEVVEMKKLEPPAELPADGPEATVQIIIYGFPR